MRLVCVLAALTASGVCVSGVRGDSVVVLGGRKTGCEGGEGGDACREPQPTFRPYSQQELEALLEQRLAQFANVKSGKRPVPPANKLADLYTDAEDAVINVLESGEDGVGGGDRDQEQSKSSQWHQAHSQPRPGDDHRDQSGWVTLEPIPWAHSQIQKWEPHAKPQIPSWESGGGFGGNNWPHQGDERPWQGPVKPSGSSHYQYGYDKPSSASHHWGGRPTPDIITDDRPDRFPTRPWPDQQSYSSSVSSPQVSRPRPGEGDGQWVLLSSTKGYSVPQHNRHGYQRALRADTVSGVKNPTASLSGHRTVRLTVLPPADDSSVTTKLSHNGLLEVESSGQTVEEAQREHAAKMLKLPERDQEDVRENEVKPSPKKSKTSARRSGTGVQVYGSSSAAAAADRTAVLAALGAGALPATLAVLVPMALGRRRRREVPDAGPLITAWHT